MEGKLERDVSKFAKMDPYVKVSYREWDSETRIHRKGGKKPVWGDCFGIDVKYTGDDIRLECWDSSTTGDKLIGCTGLPTSTFTANGGFDGWVSLEHKGKPAGYLHLQSHYDKDALAKAQKGAASTGPAPFTIFVGSQGPQINMNHNMVQLELVQQPVQLAMPQQNMMQSQQMQMSGQNFHPSAQQMAPQQPQQQFQQQQVQHQMQGQMQGQN